ncbi:uncharacterized protein LOC112541832 [Python bivittatus]|uniref:Uncharacterized protein LOC112541832 n=1 Tax=Python bivittatus TaxID=176946 RepID=A0A9F5IYW3_PYTBI|nr:uncharacterized protein LOC112541832 [Python bivittatus]
MSHASNVLSRPEDLNCCFWNMLLLLAEEPAFEGLREALSSGSAAPVHPGAPEEAPPPSEATRPGYHLFVVSGHEANASAEEAPEGSEGAAALPGRTLSAEGTARAGEARGNHPRPPNWDPVTENQAPHGVSPGPEGPGSIQALRLVERTGHPRIWKAYNSGLLSFLTFREDAGMPSVWPIPGIQIRGFLLSLDSQGVSAAKIFTYLAGLSYISQMFNFQDPLQDFFTVNLVVGLQWQRGPPIPLSLQTLESLMDALESVCHCFYECLLYRAVFLLSFFGALRPEEMVAERGTALHTGLLCLSDIEIQQDSIGLHLRAPQMSQGWFTFWLGLSEKPWLCPVLALHNYLAVRPSGEGPLFLYGNRHLLYRERFLKIFHAALRRLDLPSERYGIQSFWLGSVTNAVRYRYPEKVILHLARWPCGPLPDGQL